MEQQSNSKKFIGIIFGIIVLVGVAAVSLLGGKDKTEVVLDDQTTSPVPETPVTSTPGVKPTLATLYKDGTYTANGSYMSPGGKDTISVELVLSGDHITSISLTPVVADDTSREYIGKFNSGYKQYVIGKNIAEVKLSKVSGSSLTSAGFNSALSTIKSQAKV